MEMGGMEGAGESGVLFVCQVKYINYACRKYAFQLLLMASVLVACVVANQWKWNATR